MLKTHKNNDRAQGILFIILAGFFFSSMSLVLRMAGDLPTMQKAFFRNSVAAVISTFLLLRTPEKFHIRKKSLPSLFMRSICGMVGMVANFYVIDRIGLSDANMLNKLSPFFAIVASVFILHEVADKVEWLCVGIAFAGALFIIKPSADVTSVYGLIGLLGGFGAGMAYTFVRKLGKAGERGPVIVMFFSVFSTLVCLPFMIFGYEQMTLRQTILLVSTGFLAAGGQLSITKAYTKAPAKEISVFDYCQILFSALFGALHFDEYPDVLSIVGYLVIIAVAVVKWRYGMKKNPVPAESQ